jgi:tetratricopeptide (TPR) repeat protein
MRSTLTRSVLIIISILFTASLTFAARQARIKGTVKDVEGKGVPGAKITITCVEQGDFLKVVECRKNGTYSLLLVDATRNYVFTVEAEGFVSIEQPVKVGAGTTDNVIDIELKTPTQVNEQETEKLLEQPGYRELEDARLAYEAGDFATAKEKFTAAVEILPDLVQGWMGLAKIADEADDAETALVNAKKCLELDDESISCLAIAVNATSALGLKDENERYVAQYQQLNPEDPAMIFNEAAGFLNAMDDEKAKPLLEQCLDVDPDFAKCLFEYGMLLLRGGDLEGAKTYLQKYLKVEPEGADAATAAETIKYL